MNNSNPLLDEVFLQNLYSDRHKEIYARIIALDKDENPIEQIEGQVTGGSVSLDGSSNVRRSCNLTMIAQEMDINAYYWGLKNKFKLYIGLSNHINKAYEDIIWFPFGVMVITNFSTSQSTNGYNISISGKDKMCLLNGELSGSLFASVDFGKEEYYDTETKITTIADIPIKQIVREAVHEYAGEPWKNIVINDLDDYGLELLDYRGSKPLYLIIAEESGSNENLGDVIQITLDGSTPITDVESGASLRIDSIIHNPRTSLNFEQADLGDYTIGYFGSKLVSVAKVEYGQTCGYRYTDITYAGDLILNVGEPVTAMLDKLVAMLGNWEYFYDVDGRFIFQRKKTYLDKTWNTIVTNNDNSYVPTEGETYAESALWSSAVSWNFTDGFLVTAFNNSPVLSNVHNDYSIWGTRQSISGVELPVHLRYAIDKKPTYYKTIEGVEWCSTDEEWTIIGGEAVTDYNYELLVQNITAQKQADLNNFELQYPAITGLTAPQKQEDGTWTPGWWDIRDWHNYYIALTGKEPKGTMKWYSSNDLNGCVGGEAFSNLIENGYTLSSSLANNDAKVWLIVVDTNTKQIDLSHGFGVPNTSNPTLNTYYESYFLDENIPDTVVTLSTPTSIIDPTTHATVAYSYKSKYYDSSTKEWKTTKNFIHPYSRCSDTHTYLSFLIETMGIYGDNTNGNGKIVYFYNPQFPEGESLEDIIKTEFNTYSVKELNELLLSDYNYEIVSHKKNCDWREIIFQMAKDYRKYGHYTPYDPDDGKEHLFTNEELLNIAENFGTVIRENNGKNSENEWYYPTGKTGYEQYYTDLEGFWRQLYCPPQLLPQWYATGVWTDRPQGDGQQYTITMADKTEISFFVSTNWVNEGDATKDGWNTLVIDSPASLNFWFDFLDADKDSDFAKYSVPIIGDRAKSVNDNMVKAIYFREVPNTIFTENLSTTEHKSGYTYMQYQNSMAGLFTVSSQGKCAIDVMEEWINNYVYAVESVSMTTVPIYHLQPNTRIKVMNAESKINGDYIVSRISIPLTYNGTMSITATKVADRVY